MKHLNGLERNDFCDLDKPCKRACQKGKTESNGKARREASQNEFMEKGGVPDRVKSFREINSGQDHPRSRPGFVKPIRDGLRKIKNLI